MGRGTSKVGGRNTTKAASWLNKNFIHSGYETLNSIDNVRHNANGTTEISFTYTTKTVEAGGRNGYVRSQRRVTVNGEI